MTDNLKKVFENIPSIECLSGTQINDIMDLYEKKYNDFKFLGAIPIDFEKNPSYNINKVNFQDLIDSEKTKIGVVFNLHESYKPGLRWVSLFVDLETKIIIFFDPFETVMDLRICKLIEKIKYFFEHN